MVVIVRSGLAGPLAAVLHRSEVWARLPLPRLGSGDADRDWASQLHMWTGSPSQGVLQCFDQIACVHMFGLLVRSHMNAGQDGFRDKGSKQHGGLMEGHWS